MEFITKMKVFVLNCGSSSIKSFLYDIEKNSNVYKTPLWEAHLEWKKSFSEPFLKVKNREGICREEALSFKTAHEALSYLIQFLFQGKIAVLGSLEEVDVIGHRIVHGGREFKEATLVTKEVKEKIRALANLAPLHNLIELEGIEILEKLFIGTPQIALFDTAFHHTLPMSAKVYPGPYRWYEEGIQRYGFHGISFQYCSKRALEMVRVNEQGAKMVICHLGSGASLCALKEGKSIDTTMGFTPLDGLMMDTRSGSVDPGILLHLLEKNKKTLSELSQELYSESGLLGVSGFSSDMRDIVQKNIEEDDRSRLALEIYIHRLCSLIGSMVVSLKGLDTLIFTAGIGENSPYIREKVCEAFSFMGMKLDKEKNLKANCEDIDLSLKESTIKVLVIHTQEAFEIALECINKIS
jgi:acetate kinase